MKFKLISIYIIVISLLLSACNMQMPNTKEPEPVVGTNGLIVEIDNSRMLDSIYEKDFYYIPIHLKNKGGSDISNGIVDVSVDSHMFSIENKNEFSTFNLRGDDGMFHGEETISEIKLKAKEFKIQGITQQTGDVKVNVCYDYKTLFEDSFCIDTDVRNQQNKKPCKVSSLSGSRGQGAPVVIELLEPFITPGENGARITFNIKLANRGGGTVLKKGSAAAVCTSTFSRDDFGIVKIKEITLSQYKLSNNKIRCDSHTSADNEYDVADQKQKHIRCQLTQEVPYTMGTFLTPIYIELEYGYLESKSTKVTVKKIGSTGDNWA